MQRHGLSDEDLAGFWPREPHVIVGDDVPQGYYEKIDAELEARLDRWHREVHPKIRDGAGLIAALQPLIREAARRSSPESTVALTVRQFEGFAYGRLRDVRVDGDQAVGEIRVKSRFGAFVDSDCFAGVATAVGSDNGSVAPAAAFHNVVLDDASGVYCWLSQVAGDIRALSRSMQRPRMVLVGLPTGDVAVAPIEFEMGDAHGTGESRSDANEGDLNVMERGDKRDEGQEFDLSNNGTRTVTQAKVRFERIGGHWLINSIDY